MIPLAQAEQLFEQAARAADDLVHVEVQPGDANGQLRAWDGRWSRFVAGLDEAPYSSMCASAREAPCTSRAVDALLCYVGQDLRLAREGAFDEERYFYEQLPGKMRARRVVADEALRRGRESLTCEDLENINAAQLRLDEEEYRARRSAPNAEAAGRRSPDAASTPPVTPQAPTTISQPPTAPLAPAPVSSPLGFEEADRTVRDTIAAFEDLDIVFVDGARAARRRSLTDALLLVSSVQAWRSRWPELTRDIGRLSATACTVPDPIRALTCEVDADFLRWSREVDAAGSDRNPVRAMQRAHASTTRLLRVLGGRLQRAEAIARRRARDPMSRILADG